VTALRDALQVQRLAVMRRRRADREAKAKAAACACPMCVAKRAGGGKSLAEVLLGITQDDPQADAIASSKAH
jgi:hypothetical protein